MGMFGVQLQFIVLGSESCFCGNNDVPEHIALANYKQEK